MSVYKIVARAWSIFAFIKNRPSLGDLQYVLAHGNERQMVVVKFRFRQKPAFAFEGGISGACARKDLTMKPFAMVLCAALLGCDPSVGGGGGGGGTSCQDICDETRRSATTVIRIPASPACWCRMPSSMPACRRVRWGDRTQPS